MSGMVGRREGVPLYPVLRFFVLTLLSFYSSLNGSRRGFQSYVVVRFGRQTHNYISVICNISICTIFYLPYRP